MTAFAEPLIKFDPMSAIPRPLFAAGALEGEEKDGRITSLVVTKSNRLVMADFTNMEIKYVNLDQPSAPISFCINARPWDLTIFKDDVVAVTSWTQIIDLLEVSDKGIFPLRQIKTKWRYLCVASDGDGDQLVVAKDKDIDGPSLIDVITIEGNVLWTVADSTSIPQLNHPVSLCLLNEHVLVSAQNGMIHKVHVATGEPSQPLTHSDLKWPAQVTADAAGNVYVASHQEQCVLVFSVEGQSRQLLTGSQHGQEEKDKPQAVAIVDTGIVVSWEDKNGHSLVNGFCLSSVDV